MGSGALVIAAAAGFAGAATGGLGRTRLALAGLVAAVVALVVALVVLGSAFVELDLANAYVADNARRGTRGAYRLAGLWGGMDGSLLLWTTLLALVATLGATSARVPLRSHYLAVVSGLVGALALVSRLAASPFRRLDLPAVDGIGLTPILEHPAMLYHPPLLYLGLVATVVPFALAVTSRGDLAAVVPVRRWCAGALAVLTAGLATGANWAYVEIGWGGFWGWDPVENAALVPWLALVAALHVPRPMLRRRMLVLTGALPFLLASVGAVVARSGANVSVHSFAEDPAVGWALGVVLVGLAGVAVRAAVASPAAVAVVRVKSATMVAVGTALLAATLVLTGVLYPSAAGWFGADTSVVTGTYYAQVLWPVGLVAVVGAAWAIGRHRRPIPMVLAHAGVLVMAVGVIGSMFASRETVVLAVGESIEVGGHRFTNEGVGLAGDNRVVATMSVGRGDNTQAALRPELRVVPERAAALAETALRSTPLADVQVALRRGGDDGTGVFDIAVRPLVWWVWWGAALVSTGAAAAAITRRGRACGQAAGRGSPTVPAPRAEVPASSVAPESAG